jgi:hypothetical protein
MTKTIRDVLTARQRDPESGRPQQLEALKRCLDDDGPIVTWVHGPLGSGKSALMDAFADACSDSGTRVITIDCRAVEPTTAGLIGHLSEILGNPLDSLDGAADAISVAPVVLAFHNYEVFRLADAWLRRDFIPALSNLARVVLVSRETPSAGWISATEWQPFFANISLQTVDSPDPDELTDRCIAEISDDATREALDALSVVRRITRPMIGALCEEADADVLYRALADLTFVEKGRDGLAMNDTVRKVIGTRFRGADSDRYRESQQAAWKLLRRHLRDAAPADLWRSTADAIFLIENPVVREAFFPSHSAQYSVDPAMPGDRDAIMDIVGRHEPPAAAAAMQLWWQHLPQAFHVLRDASGAIVGFYCVARPDELGGDWMQRDPVARHWQRHLDTEGRRRRVSALFLRRWLSVEEGEAPSPIQAAAWVDIKRMYLELRPALRRVYLCLADIGPYGPVATELGFSVLEELAAACDAATYHTAMLDFGPGSVDGWIVNLVGAEIGVAADQLLDASRRELVIGDTRIPLTPLEFGVVAMLESRGGEPISRSELLQQVWGRDYDGGSNVVDAVVRGLRKKCGHGTDIVETVRGVGYRLRA